MRQKKNFIIFTAFIIIAVSVFCAVISKKTQQQTLTVTDVDGVTYIAIIDQNNEVYAGVTDTDGNMYAAKIANGVVLKDQPLYIVDNYEGTFPYNDTTRSDDININLNNSENINFSETATQAATTAAPVQGDSEKMTVGGETTSASADNEKKPQEEYLSDKFIKLFNSGIFAMTFTTDDPDLTEDITMAVNNGNIYMDTSMEGISCKILFDAQKNKGYIIIPQMRVYCALPEDLASDLASTEFEMNDISEAVSASTSTVEIDGRECICEEFGYEDGSLKSFYFYNGNLIRMTDISDGETTVYNLKTLTSDVDKSYFELPKGYIKVDLSWLQMQEN